MAPRNVFKQSLTRRGALAAGAGAAASLGLGALPAWARVRAPGDPRLHGLRPDELPHADRAMGDPAIPQIETLVLVMLENHSADNLLGLLPRLAPDRRRHFDGLPVNRRGVPTASNPDGHGGRVRSFHAPDL